MTECHSSVVLFALLIRAVVMVVTFLAFVKISHSSRMPQSMRWVVYSSLVALAFTTMVSIVRVFEPTARYAMLLSHVMMSCAILTVSYVVLRYVTNVSFSGNRVAE